MFQFEQSTIKKIGYMPGVFLGSAIINATSAMGVVYGIAGRMSGDKDNFMANALDTLGVTPQQSANLLLGTIALAMTSIIGHIGSKIVYNNIDHSKTASQTEEKFQPPSSPYLDNMMNTYAQKKAAWISSRGNAQHSTKHYYESGSDLLNYRLENNINVQDVKPLPVKSQRSAYAL
ncbi:MAG TPA: hypothetical protein VGF14_07390 [Alphaproteobacteria bacterium]